MRRLPRLWLKNLSAIIKNNRIRELMKKTLGSWPKGG